MSKQEIIDTLEHQNEQLKKERELWKVERKEMQESIDYLYANRRFEAAKAILNGMLSNPKLCNADWSHDVDKVTEAFKIIPKVAVEQADALLEELDRDEAQE